jgi:hypothetical protein
VGEAALTRRSQRAGVGGVHHVPLEGHTAAEVEREHQHAEEADEGDPDDGQRGPSLPLAKLSQGEAPHSHRNTALIVGVSVTSFQNGMLTSRLWSHETVTSWPASESRQPSGLLAPFTLIE